jgi:phosphoribosylglycinamide formyltransferase-1
LARDQFTEIGEFHDALLRVLSEAQTDLIVLAGYMKKIGAPILQKYFHRVLNIHPALLPAFGGKGMYGNSVHRAVLDYGAKISGITVHLVDEEYDHGPIVLQKAIEIDEGETEASLASKIQALEHRYYVEAIRWFADGRVRINGRQVSIISH